MPDMTWASGENVAAALVDALQRTAVTPEVLVLNPNTLEDIERVAEVDIDSLVHSVLDTPVTIATSHNIPYGELCLL